MTLALRKIRFGPPAADVEPSELSFADAVLKARRAGAPELALQALEQLRETPSLAAARTWYRSARKAPLVLLGPTGRGKSTAAAWCCVEFAKTWPWNGLGRLLEPLVWLDATYLVRLREWTDVGAEYVDRCLRAQLLVVDDAGHEGTSTGRQALIDLLMKRTDRARGTILSANLTGAEFRARYTEPLADRLRHLAVVPELAGGTSERAHRTARPAAELVAELELERAAEADRQRELEGLAPQTSARRRADGDSEESRT